jgi:hypothetical protein
MATKTAPSLSTIARLLDEVDEFFSRVQKVRSQLKRLKPGSEAYHELLPDLDVQLYWLKLKAESAHRALEEYEDSLPEDE